MSAAAVQRMFERDTPALSAFDSERLDRLAAAALSGLLADPRRSRDVEAIAREAVSAARAVLEEIRRQTLA